MNSRTLLPMFDAPVWMPRSIVTAFGVKRDEEVTQADS